MSFKEEMLKSFGLTDALDFEGRKINVCVQPYEIGHTRIRFTPMMVVDYNDLMELHLPKEIWIRGEVYRTLTWNGEWYLLSDGNQVLPASLSFADNPPPAD